MTQPPLSRQEIESVLGRVPDYVASAIIGTGASLEDVEVAEQWASGRNELFGADGHPLAGAAAAVYEILIADQAPDDNEH